MSEWVSTKLGELISITRGTTYKSLLLDQPGPALLGLASIQRDGGFRGDKLRTYGGESPEKLLVRPGELFASLKDVTQSGDLLGSVARVPDDGPIGRLSQDTVRLDFISSKVDPDFLYMSLLSPRYRAWCRRHATGTTNLGLPRDDFLAFEVLHPTEIEDQRALADVLGTIDDLIENNRRRVGLLEEMARAIYHEWFVRFRYPGHESVPLVDSPLGPIPEGWAVRTMGEAIELRYGKALTADARRGGDVAVVSSAGLVGWHDKKLVNGPAIVVGRKGNVGSVHWIDGDCWPIDTAYYVVTDLPLRFVAEQLRGVEFVNSHAAVPGLSREMAYSRMFLVPEVGVAAGYQEAADALGEQGSALVAQSDRLAGLRGLLLPKLVTGQIDVSRLDLDALVEVGTA
jgi:type I restriction enzyme S subunit